MNVFCSRQKKRENSTYFLCKLFCANFLSCFLVLIFFSFVPCLCPLEEKSFFSCSEKKTRSSRLMWNKSLISILVFGYRNWLPDRPLKHAELRQAILSDFRCKIQSLSQQHRIACRDTFVLELQRLLLRKIKNKKRENVSLCAVATAKNRQK